MSDRKAEFYWAIIGDANPEPVAVTVEDGKRVAYTIGCADPFYIDDGNIELIPPASGAWQSMPSLSADIVSPMTVPMKPSERALQREESERWLAAERKRGIRHGWRRWNP